MSSNAMPPADNIKRVEQLESWKIEIVGRVFENDDSLEKRLKGVEDRERSYVTLSTFLWFLGSWLGIQALIFIGGYSLLSSKIEKIDNSIERVSELSNESRASIQYMRGIIERLVAIPDEKR